MRQDPQGEGRLHDSIRESDKQSGCSVVFAAAFFFLMTNLSRKSQLANCRAQKFLFPLRGVIPNRRAMPATFLLNALHARREGIGSAAASRKHSQAISPVDLSVILMMKTNEYDKRPEAVRAFEEA